MNAAIFKNRRRLPENKIDVTFDVAIFKILPSVFGVKRVLPAEESAIFENEPVGVRKHGDGLRAALTLIGFEIEGIFKSQVFSVKIVPADVDGVRGGSRPG